MAHGQAVGRVVRVVFCGGVHYIDSGFAGLQRGAVEHHFGHCTGRTQRQGDRRRRLACECAHERAHRVALSHFFHALTIAIVRTRLAE